MSSQVTESPLLSYYDWRKQHLETTLRQKKKLLGRIRAERNLTNAAVRSLKEELKLLQEPAASTAEVTKILHEDYIVVNGSDGKMITKCDDDSKVTYEDLEIGTRVALSASSQEIFQILPKTHDPLISLMKVEKTGTTTYDQIGGLEKQIAQVREIIELPIRHPEIFESLGIQQPKGVLMYGPPGTGKTLVAKAVAHHSNCTFIRVSGTELVQKYIGEGTRMLRELFAMARNHSPSIIFMDEIDSIGGKRLTGSGSRDSEVQRTMLELLNQLDGFEPSKNIKVLMATNRIDILDPALLRPGRIDRKIEFPHPNQASRLSILRIHSRKMNLERSIDLKKISFLAAGGSGADMKAICTEAGMFALRDRRVHVIQDDFEMSVSKVLKKNLEPESVLQMFK